MNMTAAAAKIFTLITSPKYYKNPISLYLNFKRKKNLKCAFKTVLENWILLLLITYFSKPIEETFNHS